jgi:hypothetical protein
MQTLINYIRPLALIPIQVVSGDSVFPSVDTKGLVAASGSVTIATAPSNGHTVTIGTKVFTFKTALSTGPGVDGEVLIGISAATALANLKMAINREGGTPDTEYPTETVRHPTVIAGTIASTVLPLSARASGEAGNNIALADGMSGSGNVVSGATLTGGRDGEQFDSALVRVAVGNIANTPDTLEISITECDLADFSDGETECAGGEEFEVAADTIYTKQIIRTKKFIRAKVNFTGGSSPTAELSVDAVFANWAIPMTIQS